MKIQFQVGGELPSTTALDAERARAARALRVNRWVAVPWLGLAVYLGYLAWKATWLIQAGDAHPAIQGLAATLLTIAVFGVAVAAFNVWQEHWCSIARRLEVLDLSQAESALALSEKHDEVDAYRRAVVATRQLTNGDLAAMEAFVLEQDTKRNIAALRDRQGAAFQALHKA